MSQPLRVGALFCGEVQLLDASSIDLFGMLSKHYLEECMLPADIVALGIPVDIFYIAPTAPTPAFAPCTASAALRTNANIHSAEVAAGSLDVLLIPGPDPRATPSKEVLDFIRSHKGHADILSVCTGILPLVMSGVLEGLVGTGPRELVPMLREKFPDVKWEVKRWTQSEKVWCSGGITNGMDMIAAYLKHRIPGKLAEMVCQMADVGGRGQKYES